MLSPSHDRSFRARRWLSLAAVLLTFSTPLLGVASRIENEKDAHAPANNNDDDADATDPAVIAGVVGSSDMTLLLEVELNGQSTEKIGEFTVRRGKLMAKVSELQELRFQLPAKRGLKPTSLVALADLPGVSFTVDQVNQVLHVTIAANGLQPTVLGTLPTEGSQGRRVIESGTGVTMNYDILDTVASGKSGTTGSFDARVFSPFGIVSSTSLAYAGNASGSAGNKHPVRLDSTYTFADVNTLRRYSLGDFITGGLPWSRPVHMEGLQIRSDFSMRPDLITFPMPTVKGSVAVPSSVNVLVNGNLVSSGSVAAGPFEVPQLPVMSGAGTISLAMTNALGQQVVVTQPFYASAAMLARGLQTYAAQAGPVRRNWGTVSNDFGKIAATGSYRRGLTNKFTIEGTIETAPDTLVAGGGGVAQIGTLAVLNFSGAGSFGSDHSGGQVSAGVQHIGRLFSAGSAATIATRGYWDVAAMNGDGILRRQLSAFTSLSLRRLGSVGMAYAAASQDSSPRPLAANIVTSQSSRVVTANYSRQFHHMSFSASLFKSLGSGGSTGAQFGLSIPFGKRSSADISVSSDGYAAVSAQKPVTDIGEWGYQAYAAAGKLDHEFAQVSYKSPKGLFSAGIDSNGGATTLRMESTGAISFADRGLFLSNLIYDSFAIVDTNPMHHVTVLEENRDVGRTGNSGRLLVADMHSFELNHITIEPTNLPPDVTIHDGSRAIRPQDRSGVVVKFAMKPSHGALLHLTDESGKPVPLGSTARLDSTGVVVPVGYDGDAYVEDLSPHNVLTVERFDGRNCRAIFDYQARPGEIPSIGPVICVEPKP